MTASGLLLRPDPGVPTNPDATPAPGATLGKFGTLADWLDLVPGWTWAATLTGLLVIALVTLPIARTLAFRAGRRAAGDQDENSARDRVLLVLAVTPSALLWITVLIGSARGLIGFGRDTLRWTDGWEALVPATLDGVGVSFGLLAFLAIRNNRNPDRSARLAATAMLAGAGINFIHEAGLPGGSWLGGAYLALMSAFGLLIFHELLAQFEDGAGAIRRTNPKFGLRWVTWPSNTACAWVAWRNYPAKPLPADATEAQTMWWGSVNHAVQHLGVVRRAKRIARFAVDSEDGRLPAPWWAPAFPWKRMRQLDAAFTEQTATADTIRAERAQIAEQLERIIAEHRDAVAAAERATERIARADAERATAERRAQEAEQAAERARRNAVEQVERIRAEAAERERNLLEEHAERLASLRSTNGSGPGRGGRSVIPLSRRSKNGSRPSTSTMDDTGALAAMFAEHPEPDFAWTDRETNRITGAGFSSRAPRLTAAATEHQRTCPAERHSGCFRSDADDQEDSREPAYATA